MPRKVELSVSQARVLASQARLIGYIAGVGSGKTMIGAVKSIAKINEGESGIVVGTDFPHFARSTWVEFAKWLPWSRCTNRQLDHPYTAKKVLTFDIGGKVVTVHYGAMENVEAWSGINANWFWFDESRREKSRRAFDVLTQRLRIGHNPQGWTTTTPSGVGHWLHDVFVKGIFPQGILDLYAELGYTGPMVEYVKGSTRENEKNLDKMYYETLLGLYSADDKLAAQELEGEFVTLEGQVWSQWSSEEGPGNVTRAADYTSGIPVEWWIDDGFTKKHPRVILFAQIVPPFANVFAEYVCKMELPEVTIAKCLEMSRVFGWAKPNVIFIDSSAAELKSRLWEQDIDTVGATHDIEDGIKHVSAWIKGADGTRYLRFHPRCKYSIGEIPSYVRDEDTMKPIKDLDHASDALRYGLYFKDLAEIKKEGIVAKLTPDQRRTISEKQGDSRTPPSDPEELWKWNFEKEMHGYIGTSV